MDTFHVVIGLNTPLRGTCFRTEYRELDARNSQMELFCKKSIYKSFAKFTARHLCQIRFFNKVTEACNFVEKETVEQEFSCEFCVIFQSSFLYRIPTVAASDAHYLMPRIIVILLVKYYQWGINFSDYYNQAYQAFVCKTTVFSFTVLKLEHFIVN